MKRVWVLNRGAFFAKERYLFLPVVFFFIPMGVLFLVLFGETGPTRKRSRAFAGKRGRRGGGNEISSPPRARAPTKEFSLARKKKRKRVAPKVPSRCASRDASALFVRVSLAFSRDSRPGCIMTFWLHIVSNCFGEMKWIVRRFAR